MTTIYAYANPAGDAARYIVRYSALQHVVTVTEPYRWAGAECTKVEPPTWVMSVGEQELWDAARTFADEDGMVDVVGAARVLDADGLAVLVEALRIYFGVPVEMGAA